MKKIFYLNFILIIFFLVSCSSVPPSPLEGNNSLISIQFGSIAKTGLLSWEPIRPDKIFFIRLNDDNSIEREEIIDSNYNIEAWWGDNLLGRNTTYLFNVPPGRYAAVAACGIGYMNSTEVFILFSEDLIKSTIIDVKPGSFVYMGAFLTESNLYNEVTTKNDNIQKYYFNYFSAIHKKHESLLTDLFFKKKFKYFNASLKEKKIDKDSKETFLKSQLDEFKGTVWELSIKKELELLK